MKLVLSEEKKKEVEPISSNETVTNSVVAVCELSPPKEYVAIDYEN